MLNTKRMTILFFFFSRFNKLYVKDNRNEKYILCCCRREADAGTSLLMMSKRASLSSFLSPTKNWEQMCRHIRTPLWKRLLLACKGIWKSGFSRRKYRNNHRRRGKPQLQSLVNEACQFFQIQTSQMRLRCYQTLLI